MAVFGCEIKMSITAVKDASSLAQHYGVPAPLVNLYFCIFNNRLYAMEPFLVMMAQRKGIQRIALTEPVQKERNHNASES